MKRSEPTRPPEQRVARAAVSAPHPKAGCRPEIVLAVIGLVVAATIGLWWRNTPSISGLGDWLTNAGRLCGLLGALAVVAVVALMARLPPLERGVGADRLARWHAHGGRYAVCLIVAHALLIIWGYSVTAHTNVVSESGTLLFTYPDVLMATVGGLLFVGVGVTSARAARRRMRYETWYYLHFYTYLAVALAFSHQFATGAEFINDRLARFAWSAMYIVVAAAIFWYRFVMPVVQAARHRLRVIAVQHEGPGVISVVIGGHRLGDLQAHAGHFFRWRFLTKQLWWSSNPYSLSAAPNGSDLRITIKDLGDQSAALFALQPGTRVLAEGPFGAMTAARRTQRKVLLIGGGIGITPLRALFESLPADPGDLTLLYRVSTETDAVLRHELGAIARTRGARVHVLAGSRRELGYDPLNASSLKANIPDIQDHDVYVCGPDQMAESVTKALRTAKVPARRIHRESFTL